MYGFSGTGIWSMRSTLKRVSPLGELGRYVPVTRIHEPPVGRDGAPTIVVMNGSASATQHHILSRASTQA